MNRVLDEQDYCTKNLITISTTLGETLTKSKGCSYLLQFTLLFYLGVLARQFAM